MRDIKAFTFVEITVVVCIIAVVSSVAMPAIDNFMSSQRVSAEGEYFVSSVRMARYKAMQENALHRLVIEQDESGKVVGYKIQIYSEYNQDGYTNEIWNEDSSDEAELGSTSSSKKIDFKKISRNEAYWDSILDSNEIIFDSSLEVKYQGEKNGGGYGQNTIFFHPSGYLVFSDASTHSDGSYDLSKYILLSENQLIITYGSAKANIHFNAMGILSSELLMEDEEETTGDEE